MKHYRLLRNNKESGPYSANELIQSGLKAYDLIWVDGKSAGWRYPSEIEEFKPYAPLVEEQPFDRFYKKPSSFTSTASSVSSKKEVIVTNVQTVPAIEVKKEKPRIKIKADCRKIDPPVFAVNSSGDETLKPVQPASVSAPDWKDILMDWEKGKKEVANISYSTDNNGNNAVIVGTKFSQSLDEIKERYAETILKPGKNGANNGSNGYGLVIVLILAVLGMGTWISINWSSENEVALHQNQELPQSPDQTVNQNNTENLTELKEEDNSGELPVVSSNEQNPRTVKQEDLNLEKNTITKKASYAQSSVPLTSHKPKQQQKEKNYNDEPVTTTDVENNTAETTMPVEEKTDPSFAILRSKPEPQIRDYIAVDSCTPSSSGAVGVKYKVRNISDIPVDLVMVDLQYYDNNGKYQKGETIYLRNIGAGQTLTVPAPDNAAAAKVDFRISMVSSEEKGLYIIAD